MILENFKARYFQFLLAALFGLVGLKTQAQIPEVSLVLNSLEDLAAKLEGANLDLQSYRLKMRENYLNYQAARSYFLPAVSASFNGQNNLELATTPLPGELFGQPGTVVNAQFGQEYTYNAGILIQKDVLDWGAMLKIRSLKMQTKISTLEAEAFKEQLCQQAYLHYFTILVGKEALRLQVLDKAFSDSIVLLYEDKYAAGEIDLMMLNQAKLNSKSIAQNVVQQQSLLEESLSTLKFLLNLRPEANLEVSDTLDYRAFPIVQQQDINPLKSIELAAVQNHIAKNRVQQQSSAFLPKLSVQAYFGQQQFGDSPDLNLGTNAWTPYNYLGLSLNLPLFTGFNSLNRLGAEKVSLKNATLNLNKTQSDAEFSDSKLLFDYHQSFKQVLIAREILDLRKQNSNLALKQYQAGLISADRQFDLYNDYLKAENNYLNALLMAYQYYSQLKPRMLET